MFWYDRLLLLLFWRFFLPLLFPLSLWLLEFCSQSQRSCWLTLWSAAVLTYLFCDNCWCGFFSSVPGANLHVDSYLARCCLLVMALFFDSMTAAVVVGLFRRGGGGVPLPLLLLLLGLFVFFWFCCSCCSVPRANLRKDEPETRVPFRESKLTHLFKNHLQVQFFSSLFLILYCSQCLYHIYTFNSVHSINTFLSVHNINTLNSVDNNAFHNFNTCSIHAFHIVHDIYTKNSVDINTLLV